MDHSAALGAAQTSCEYFNGLFDVVTVNKAAVNYNYIYGETLLIESLCVHPNLSLLLVFSPDAARLLRLNQISFKSCQRKTLEPHVTRKLQIQVIIIHGFSTTSHHFHISTFQRSLSPDAYLLCLLHLLLLL